MKSRPKLTPKLLAAARHETFVARPAAEREERIQNKRRRSQRSMERALDKAFNEESSSIIPVKPVVK